MTSLHINFEYRLDKDVRIFGVTGGTIPADTVVKLLYFDSCVANVEVIEGAFDGLQFAMPPEGLV
jgi:hypothetical protein